MADVELDVGVAHLQRLGVGVRRDELDAAQAGVDHAVDGVGAAAADADDLDHCEVAAAASIMRFRPTLELESRLLPAIAELETKSTVRIGIRRCQRQATAARTVAGEDWL